MLVRFLPEDTTRAIGTFILLGFFATLIVLTKLDLLEYCAAGFCAFVVFSKIVNEQYLVWALPFLVLLVAQRRGRHHTWMLGVFTVVGTVINPLIHPLGLQGHTDTFWINFVLAGSTTAYLVIEWRAQQARLRAHELDGFDEEYLDESERALLVASAPVDIVR